MASGRLDVRSGSKADKQFWAKISLCSLLSDSGQDLSPRASRQARPPLELRSTTMQNNTDSETPKSKRIPWNKGKLTGAKPPLRQKHVWAIRTKLQIEQRPRDLALFNLAIDSKLRGCDIVALKVEDVAPNGYCVDRASVRQRKTRRPVRFELTEQTRRAVDGYVKAASKESGEFLFTACRNQAHRMTTRHYA